MNQVNNNFTSTVFARRLTVCACGCEMTIDEAFAMGEQDISSCRDCGASLDYFDVLEDYVRANWRPFTRLHRVASVQR
ncbi:MAG: hypothetical protein HY253_06665 [Burkholderiales bacterium]|nr:hypothetical protein [Burkholderiales bacterium]